MIAVRTCLVAMALLLAAPVSADEANDGAPVVVEGAREYILTVPGRDGQIRLLVWQPPGVAPAEGHPVVYAFDGGMTFGYFTDAAQNVLFRARRSGRRTPMIVGITYPAGDYTLARRNYDLTPPAQHYDMPPRPNGKPWPRMGGGDAFLDALASVVKPFVESRYPIDTREETLFGWSFGGLMVLHALFTRPEAFDRYVAASPSIWFNDKMVAREAERFLERPPSVSPIPLRLTVGGDEQTLPAEDRTDNAKRDWLSYNRMIDNARELAATLRTRGGDKVALNFEIIPDQDHGSALPTAVFTALTFAVAD